MNEITEPIAPASTALITFRDRFSMAMQILRGQKTAPNFGQSSASSLSDSFRFTGWGWNRNSGTINYAQEVGALDESSLVMAVVNWLAVQLPEAEPTVQTRNKDGALEPIPDHPCAELINRPNPFHIWADYCGALSLSWWIDGNCYFYKARDDGGEIQELWYLPHFMVEERWPNDGRSPEVPFDKDNNPFLSHYQYRVPGKAPVLYPSKDIVHIKRYVDLSNPRRGIGAFGPALKAIYGDNAAAAFSATIMRNQGMVPWLLAPKDKDQSLSETEAMAIKESFTRGTTGENAGTPLVNAIPLEVTKLGSSLEGFDLSDMRQIPESVVASLSLIPAAVLQFIVGLKNGTSFAAYAQAREQAYESVVIPIQATIAKQLTYQLLSEYKPEKGAQIIFDTAHVRVLQEDRDNVYKRAGEALKAGGITLNQFLDSVDKPQLGDEGNVYYVPGTLTPMTLERITETANGTVAAPVVDPALVGAGKLADIDRTIAYLEEQMKGFVSEASS